MCHPSVVNFVRGALAPFDIQGKDILEVGSLDVNGTARPHIVVQGSRSYVGSDLRPGPGVDLVCDVVSLGKHFGETRFDGVISTEMLEHVENWTEAIRVMKLLLKPGGWLLLTTRSPGFPLHEHPNDYWRFSEENMHQIFADFGVQLIKSDEQAPGVFVKAFKPSLWKPVDYAGVVVASV